MGVVLWQSAECVHYTHKALLDATVHIITLPEILRATLYGGVAILLSPVPPTLPIASKAPCLLFHSPLYLPEERPHFNINRMLHHAVAQTSPCCIAPVALAAAAKGRRTRRGDGAPVARRQKKQTCFVIVSNGRSGLFCLRDTIWKSTNKEI